jgi:hypothetical protein
MCLIGDCVGQCEVGSLLAEFMTGLLDVIHLAFQ